MALQSAGQKVGADEPFAEREDSVAGDQVVVPPPASIKPLAIPTHGPRKSLDQSEQAEKAAIEPSDVATNRGEVGDVGPVPCASQGLWEQTEKVRNAETGRSFKASEADKRESTMSP